MENGAAMADNDVQSREQRSQQRRASRKKDQPVETPVVVEGPVDMPDQDHLNQQVNSLQEEIDSERAKMENIKAAVRQKDDERRQLRAQIEQLRTQLDESHKVIAAKQKEKEEPVTKLKKRDAERSEIEKIRKELPCASLAALDELITAIEQQMQRVSLPLKEEKKVLADIQKYKGLKEPIKQLEAKIAAFDKDKEEYEQHAAIVRAVSAEVGVLRAKNSEIMTELTQFRTAEGELIAEIKEMRNQMDSASAKIERAYQKIRDSRSKFREQSYQFQKQEKDKAYQKRTQDRAERQQRFNKADTTAVEDMLRRQRERLQDAGIKWNVSTEPSADAPSTDTMDAPQIKFLPKPEKPVAPVMPSKPEEAVVPEVPKPKKGKPAEAAPPPPADASSEDEEEEEEVVESPEEVKRRLAEESEKRKEEEARKRAEAEEKKRKKEEIKRKKDAERAEKERQKREEKKQKKLESKAGLKHAGTDTGGGTEDDAAAQSAGPDEKSAVESGADTSDAPTKTKLSQKERDNISRKERIAKSVISESRRRDEVAQKLRKRRNRLFGLIPVPKLPDWALYLLAALLAVVLVLVYAVVARVRAGPSPLLSPLTVDAPPPPRSDA